jgi:tetratricopeptide (TPR) repeat protein
MTFHRNQSPGVFRKARMLAVFLLASTMIVSAATPAETAAKQFEALNRSGLDHYYSLEYDEAIRDFKKAADLFPEDPLVWNHLLEALLFHELYKHDALDTSLYTHHSFLDTKQVPADPAIKKEIKALTEKALALEDKLIKENPANARALYYRGVTKGLRSTYMGLIEHTWYAAVRASLSARDDHEKVLKLDPKFVDAKTVVGVHNFVVGSLPWPVKVAIGITGVHGDRDRGIQYLQEAAKAGGESSADARVALALFLRRESRYQEAIEVVHSLVLEHPRNFLFALEEANLTKDAGKGPVAVMALQKLLADCKAGRYPRPHIELVEFGLGEALRGQARYQEAVSPYEAAGNSNSINTELRQRSLVAAGEVLDVLSRRDEAVKQYQAALALDSSTEVAETAKKRINKPYKTS